MHRWFPSLFAAPRGPATASSSLLELGVDEILKREDLVPFLLGEELLLLHDDVVEALAGLVAFPGNLGALLVAERGFQHRDDAQGIEHHVSRAIRICSDSLDAVDTQAVNRALHRRDRGEERK